MALPDVPARTSDIAHGVLVVPAIGGIKGCEERCLETVDGGTEGGVESGVIANWADLGREEEGEEGRSHGCLSSQHTSDHPPRAFRTGCLAEYV